MIAIQHLGSLAVIVLFAGLFFLVYKWPQSLHVTFSHHAAAYRHTILYYIFLFSLVLPILLLFFIKWFVPTFYLSYWFTLFICVGCLLQFIVTLIPEVGGWKTIYHRNIAFLSAFCLIPALALLAFSSHISQVSRVVSISMLLSMVVIMVVFITTRKNAKYLLLLQAGYFAAFFIAILFTTYVR